MTLIRIYRNIKTVLFHKKLFLFLDANRTGEVWNRGVCSVVVYVHGTVSPQG